MSEMAGAHPVPQLQATPTAPDARSEQLIVRNLLLDFAQVAALLHAQLEMCVEPADEVTASDRALDAFLLAAGSNQILEDYLHRDLFGLGKAAGFLRARNLSLPGHALGVLLRAGLALRALRPSEQRLRSRQRALAQTVSRLADELVGEGPPEPSLASNLETAKRLCAARMPGSLRSSVLRLPNCFVSFDQRPEDCHRLAMRYAERFPDRTRPVSIVGLRTSGSYLAPLMAAYLRSVGYVRVKAMTLRPGQMWSRSERRVLLREAQAGANVALIDDAPVTGGSLRAAAAELDDIGVESTAIVLLLQIQASELPPSLDACTTVTIHGQDWCIHEQLEPFAVRVALEQFGWDDVTDVEAVERWTGRRGHASALFRVRRKHEGEALVFARGVGLGYFGRRVLAAAEPNSGLLPRVFGLKDAVLYREWLPEGGRLGPELLFPEEDLARTMGRYVLQRSIAFRVPDDVSAQLVARDAVWQNIASLLSQAFGPLRIPLRPVLHRAARRLVHVPSPSVPDGDFRLRSWFRSQGTAEVIKKIDFEDGGFRAAGLPLYNLDPIFDLAQPSVDAEVAGHSRFSELLCAQYEQLSGKTVPPERWLLYRLLLLLLVDRKQAGAYGTPRLLAVERALARVHRDYMAELFFADLEQASTGPLCAIDIDGVLETRWLPYPALGPAGAQALRTLIRHGFRPVLVSGRSIADIRDRCRAYRLAGGVAEYGAVLYDPETDETVSLLDQAAQADLDALRAVAQQTPSVSLDPDYRYGVRAFRSDELRSIDADTAARLLDEAGVAGRVRPVQGVYQTDFVSVRSDKATGLRALADRFGREATVAFAVGDTASDLPILELAERAFAPANADEALRRAAAESGGAIRLQKEPYQGGLLSAVMSFLDHAPSGCAECRPRELTPEARLLMEVLAAQDASRRKKVAHALRLAAVVARTG